MRYCIKATGSTCYDKTGITFPRVLSFNIENFLTANFGCIDFEWINQFGWSNKPEVITFKLNNEKTLSDKDMLHQLELELPIGLMVCEKDWQ